jgi:hypothetical protein
LTDEAEHIIKTDTSGNLLRGEKNYKLQLSPEIPASNFWSVIVYESETNVILCGGQPWPSVFSSSKSLLVNRDGSLDIWFGQNPLEGKEYNWIQTVPGKNWYAVVRIYGVRESKPENNWKPGEIEEI